MKSAKVAVGTVSVKEWEPMPFGQWVRHTRRLQGMTLTELARRIGSHKGYLSGIELGQVRPPSMKFLRPMVKALKTDLCVLAIRAYAEKAPALIRKDVARMLAGGM